MTLKNQLFEFDKNISLTGLCLCEEGQNPDAAIQKEELGLLHSVRNDKIIIGTDEAGRGPGAGGVFASAVYFNNLNDELIEKLSCLNDSKKLSKKKREELFKIISQNTINSTVCIEVEEIEKINILNASLKAMRLAVENVIQQICDGGKGNRKQETEDLPIQLNVIVDGNKLIKDLNCSPIHLFNYSTTIHQQFIVKGDSKSASIAAASILAKVSRDRYMEELHEKFPQYNWIKNAGYLTTEHLKAIDKYGMTHHHRKSFLRKHFEKNTQLSILQK